MLYQIKVTLFTVQIETNKRKDFTRQYLVESLPGVNDPDTFNQLSALSSDEIIRMTDVLEDSVFDNYEVYSASIDSMQLLQDIDTFNVPSNSNDLSIYKVTYTVSNTVMDKNGNMKTRTKKPKFFVTADSIESFMKTDIQDQFKSDKDFSEFETVKLSSITETSITKMLKL